MRNAHSRQVTHLTKPTCAEMSVEGLHSVSYGADMKSQIAALMVVLASLGCQDVSAHVTTWREIGLTCDGPDHKALIACLEANNLATGDERPALIAQLRALGHERDRELLILGLLSVPDPEITEAARGIARKDGIDFIEEHDFERWLSDHELDAPPTRIRKHDEFTSGDVLGKTRGRTLLDTLASSRSDALSP